MPTPKRKSGFETGTRTPARLVPVASPDRASKYQVLFDQASDAIMTVTPDFRIDAMNQAAEEMTGFMKSELESQPLQTLVPGSPTVHVPERTRILSPDFFTSPGTWEDIAIVRKDGYVRHVDLSVRLVFNRG
jgi:PAS domain S-box-containing protein